MSSEKILHIITQPPKNSKLAGSSSQNVSEPIIVPTHNAAEICSLAATYQQKIKKAIDFLRNHPTLDPQDASIVEEYKQFHTAKLKEIHQMANVYCQNSTNNINTKRALINFLKEDCQNFKDCDNRIKNIELEIKELEIQIGDLGRCFA